MLINTDLRLELAMLVDMVTSLNLSSLKQLDVLQLLKNQLLFLSVEQMLKLLGYLL